MMNKRVWRSWVCMAVAVMMATAGAAWAKRVVVTLKDGRQITGELVSESPEAVTVSIANIHTTFLRSSIANVEAKPTLEELYKEKLKRLSQDDVAGRYQLAQWLYQQGSDEQAATWSLDERKQADELAVKQLDRLLQDDANNVQAKMLRDLAAQRIEARRAAEQTPKQTPTNGTTGDEGEASRTERAAYLNDDQRNLLKIYEIDLKSRPQVVIPQSTLDKLYDNERYRSDSAMAPYQGRSGKAKLRTLPGYEQLGLLFQLRARDLYGEAQVRTEPDPLREFRQRINPTYVVGYCGRCHAYGKPGPGPKFFTRKSNSEETAYTNFLILCRMTGGRRDMIDRQNPADSLLFQYGLPAENATFPHPEVPGRRQYFTGKEDRRYENMIRWVKTLYFPTPQYPIDYTPPAMPKAEADQTAPAPSQSGAPGQ